MKKSTPLIALVAFAALAPTAQAAHPTTAPTLTTNCADPQTMWWSHDPSDGHTGHQVFRRLSAHADQPLGAEQGVYSTTGSSHNHATWLEQPQAKSSQYYVRSTHDGVPTSPNSNTGTCTEDVYWVAGAETQPEFGVTGEWADASESSAAVTFRPNFPRLKGIFSYACHVVEGTVVEGYERCEYKQGNASATDINRIRLFENSQEYWTGFAFYAKSGEVLFCGTSCSDDYVAGSIEQTKQLGGCNTPALTIPLYDEPTDTDLTIREKNSPTNACDAGSMDTLWKYTNVKWNCWTKVIQHIRISTSSSVGFVESFIDADCDAINDFEAIPANFEGTTTKTVTNEVSELGPVQRVWTWTTKNGDQPAGDCTQALGNWPCAHKRVGLYRGGDPTPNITGDSILYHDAVAAGPTAAGVIRAAF